MSDARRGLRSTRPRSAPAGAIVETVRTRGTAAVSEYAERFGEREAGASLVLEPSDMTAALARLDAEDRGALERAAARIERFARAQRESIRALTIPIPGGEAGHTVEPVASAGCYAPGGRYPLPSSVLMTAITARVAGCERVVVASPGAHPVALAAAAIAGVDAFLAVAARTRSRRSRTASRDSPGATSSRVRATGG